MQQRAQGALEDMLITGVFGLCAFPESDELWMLYGNAQYGIGYEELALAAYEKALSFGNYTAEDLPGYTALIGQE